MCVWKLICVYSASFDKQKSSHLVTLAFFSAKLRVEVDQFWSQRGNFCPKGKGKGTLTDCYTVTLENENSVISQIYLHFANAFIKPKWWVVNEIFLS